MGVGGGEKPCAEAYAHRATNKRISRKFDERELNDLRSIADLKAAAGKQTGIEGVTGVTDIPSEESQPTNRRCEFDDSAVGVLPGWGARIRKNVVSLKTLTCSDIMRIDASRRVQRIQ